MLNFQLNLLASSSLLLLAQRSRTSRVRKTTRKSVMRSNEKTIWQIRTVETMNHNASESIGTRIQT